ncbi:MAG TPA: glycogen synthase [Candidatus Baltobacteraceae bacterium]|nr:glycogen synthase [Candidatus Baltobacteraceae bacterium]
MMKVLFLTNEYPPHIYGGAGVHVGYLSRELAKSMPVEMRCFGDQRIEEGNLKVTGFELDTSDFTCPERLKSAFGAVRRCTDFNTTNIDADIVHCHTWYSHFGGILAKKNYGIPLVITVHSLEPLRPWKREQLGGGYDFSLWVEKTALEMADAIIAVSGETKRDIERLFDVGPERVHVIHNGIDPEEYCKVSSTDALKRHGIDPGKPYLLFVGRITRQKGIIYLVRAIPYMHPDFQIVLCAGAPDTPDIAQEMKDAVESATRERSDVIWIEEMVDRNAVIELYSHAAVFCCPSIYEPFGIINLEAMACETAVVASAVGGIKEVVVDGETGFLVPLEQMKESPFEPLDPDKFSRDLAAKINQLMADPKLREKFGKAGRKRAEEKFSWSAIAEKTKALYETLKH